MSIRVFSCFLAALFTVDLYASEVETASDIERDVYTFLTKNFEKSLGKDVFHSDYELKVSHLDSRLALQKCSEEKTMELVAKPQNNGHLTVKIQCTTGKRWSIYVPARLERFDQVVVAAHNLQRGQVLRKSDVKLARFKVNRLGINYIDSVEKVLGLEVKRSLRSEDLLKSSMLTQPKIVARGDKVTVESSRAGLTVSTTALAMETGELGETISVKNQSSSRVLDALVIGPGRVKIAH